MKKQISNYLVPILLCLGVSALLLSCGNNSPSEKVESTVVADSIETVNIETPKIPFPENVTILLPTQYRQESTGYPKGVKEKEWYELYKNKKNGAWMASKAKLKISYSRDECVGENVMIIASEHHNAILFFTGFEGLNEQPETILENKALLPFIPVPFSFKGKEYRLEANGNLLLDGVVLGNDDVQKKTEDELMDASISNYQLYFLDNEGRGYKIADLKEAEGVIPRLIWAGDLNNDGLPDLIINLNDFYESQHIYFFLSDSNDKEKPLKKLADLHVANDC